MTMNEFVAVMAIGGIEIIVKPALRSRTYDAFLNRSTDFFAPYSPIFSGRTKKSALKKLKDWYHWEARQNGNR